jgi:hypothetical protein
LQDQDVLQNPSAVQSTINWLSQMVADKTLQSFGIKMTISPFQFHTPAPVGALLELMTLPATIEDDIARRDVGCDLIIYPISPSIAVPSTYPMLESGLGQMIEEDDEVNIEGSSAEGMSDGTQKAQDADKLTNFDVANVAGDKGVCIHKELFPMHMCYCFCYFTLRSTSFGANENVYTNRSRSFRDSTWIWSHFFTQR